MMTTDRPVDVNCDWELFRTTAALWRMALTMKQRHDLDRHHVWHRLVGERPVADDDVPRRCPTPLPGWADELIDRYDHDGQEVPF